MRSIVAERTVLAVLSLIVLPLLVKAPLLAGVLVADPAASYAGLAASPKLVMAGQAATIDPNVAFTSHALGMYAARIIAAGGSPWWNPFEGIGTPLAGEMQSAALFPPTLLLLLPRGQVLEHVLFQVISGVTTFTLLRRLRVGIAGAWTAAAIFEFNGVYAWLANAVINPVCFLPVVLLGVEQVRMGADRWGGLLIAGGVAASIYAGFPEVAYLNSLLIAAWSICRACLLKSDERPKFLISTGVSAVAGVFLAGPLLVAFFDFVPAAYIGSHGDALARLHLLPQFGVAMIVPYFFGNIYGGNMAFWANVGGYAGASLTALAIAGALGRSERALRVMLAAWVVITLAVSFGVQPILNLFHLLPLTREAALYRYLDASWIFAACVLAGMGVDDVWARGGRNLRVGVMITAALTAGLVALAVALGERPGLSITTLDSAVVQLLAVLALAAASIRRWFAPSGRVAIIALAASGEAIALFAAPLAANPYRAEMDLRGVEFLRSHLGLQRFVSLGPIAANYGAFFELAEVNHNDLPVPQIWTDYARRRLDPRIDPTVLNPVSSESLLARLPAWAAVGTRYIVTPADKPLSQLRQVHVDRAMRVYAVPAPRPYLSAPGCAVAPRSRTEASVTCTRSSLLLRLEAYMPGWTATVNGAPTQIRADEAFQSVTLPAGTSLVRFAFVPPGMWVGYLLVVIGLALLVVVARDRNRARVPPGAVLVGA